MSMKLVYVAGPFRAETPWKIECNVRRAEEMALEVAKLGLVPVAPHAMYRHFDQSLPDSFWLEATLEILCRTDAVILCAGWTGSSGTKAEIVEANRLGLPVFCSLEQLHAWAGGSGRTPRTIGSKWQSRSRRKLGTGLAKLLKNSEKATSLPGCGNCKPKRA